MGRGEPGNTTFTAFWKNRLVSYGRFQKLVTSKKVRLAGILSG